MTGRFDNIHPELTCKQARKILLQSIDDLDSQSDYYMAASHLINCPGPETERSLADFLGCSQNEQAVKIAKRKAVEVLGRLGVTSLISNIGQCLWSDDQYLVENTVYALKQLNCRELSLVQKMQSLLKENADNQRVLIQCLSSLSARESLSLLSEFQFAESPGIRGAAISAIVQHTGDTSKLSVIVHHLTLPNQMDRQCAIQDLIDARALECLCSIVSAPVSPTFRLRACRLLITTEDLDSQAEKFLPLVDSLLVDNPDDVEIIHRYDAADPDADILIRDLFNTDFSRCYLALKSLRRCSAARLWPLIIKTWEEEAYNDYGAHYFFMRLFGSRTDWPDDSMDCILDILKSAAVNRRPQFQKSRSAAIYSISQLNSSLFLELIPGFLNEKCMPPWDCRYILIVAFESISEDVDNQRERWLMDLLADDDDVFVRARLMFKNSL
ncbi:MAG: bilin biosynthesis protein CpeY [Cyanobium sp. ARS6]|nr:bilin biosynthesis protein CpeY [Cyanobium sp. ARS6]